MSDKYRVYCRTKIRYGSQAVAWVELNACQIWELRTLPSIEHPYYSLSRHSVTIEVPQEYFRKIFEEVEE